MTVKKIEPVLRRNLLKLGSQYATLKKLSEGSVSKYATGGATFFRDLRASKISFTARKYDLIVGYFRANWPENEKFPILEEPHGPLRSTKR